MSRPKVVSIPTKTVFIDTSNILFIWGARSSAWRIVEQRTGKKSMGFIQPGENQSKEKRRCSPARRTGGPSKIWHDSEFIGRVPVAAVVEPLDEEALHRF